MKELEIQQNGKIDRSAFGTVLYELERINLRLEQIEIHLNRALQIEQPRRSWWQKIFS